MRLDETVTRSTIPSPVNQTGETGMMQRERWEEVRRLFYQERMRIREIARCLDLDRNTVRRCIRSESWQPYWREGRADTLLGEHADFLRQRAPQVNYSARILYQELSRGRGYGGSYDTVKRFVQPLREEVAVQAERVLTRFETPPGWQSQVDWGQGRVYFGQRAVVQHFFVLTLGYSRRGFYCAYPDEKLGCFLEAHERAFEHFGGHTREHLYDRPRTVCRPTEGGRVIWNPTFKAFAEYWGFEPRLCQPYRAQTKGKVESGVKYVKRNFLPGRRFFDQQDFDEQLVEWMVEVADVRVHGTTHERPIDRFSGERGHLMVTAGQPGFRLEALASRTVATDYLVSFETNRYSVPFRLIGETVQVQCRGEQLQVFHRGELVASHPVLSGKYQMRILPEHEPGAIARNARLRYSTAPGNPPGSSESTEVQVRDLALYDQLAGALEVTP